MSNACSTLTAKQVRFLAEYGKDANGTRSAIAAGYGRAGAHVTASRLLRNPKVQKALQARQRADATRLSLSRDRVVAGLLGAIEQAKLAGEPSSVIAGWREVGRMMGYYTPEVRRVEVSTAAAAVERGKLELLSDEALMAIVEGQG